MNVYRISRLIHFRRCRSTPMGPSLNSDGPGYRTWTVCLGWPGRWSLLLAGLRRDRRILGPVWSRQACPVGGSCPPGRPVILMTDAGAGRFERLSPLDVSNMRVEGHGRPMHVTAVAVVDGAPLLDAAGQLRLAAVRADMERRLHRAPRLRQVLVRPRRGLGPPVWTYDAYFDIGQHVRARVVPAPGDQEVLLAVCAELNQPPLDRSCWLGGPRARRRLPSSQRVRTGTCRRVAGGGTIREPTGGRGGTQKWSAGSPLSCWYWRSRWCSSCRQRTGSRTMTLAPPGDRFSRRHGWLRWVSC